jgi:hypothetical protein
MVRPSSSQRGSPPRGMQADAIWSCMDRMVASNRATRDVDQEIGSGTHGERSCVVAVRKQVAEPRVRNSCTLRPKDIHADHMIVDDCRSSHLVTQLNVLEDTMSACGLVRAARNVTKPQMSDVSVGCVCARRAGRIRFAADCQR